MFLVCLQTLPPAILFLDLATKEIRSYFTLAAGVPDGVQIDKKEGRLYWTNMGCRPASASNWRRELFTDRDGSIETARLDGSDHRVLVGNGAITTPKQLLLRQKDQRLYWCDREGSAVMSCQKNGDDLRVLISGSPSDELDHCVGIAIDEKHQKILWTQKGPPKAGKGRIFRAGLEIPAGETAKNRTDIEVLRANLPEPVNLALVEDILYWTDRGAPPDGNSLNMASMMEDGTLAAHHVICTGFDEAIGLMVEPQQNRAFVSDLGGNIWQVDLASGVNTCLYRKRSLTGIVAD